MSEVNEPEMTLREELEAIKTSIDRELTDVRNLDPFLVETVMGGIEVIIDKAVNAQPNVITNEPAAIVEIVPVMIMREIIAEYLAPIQEALSILMFRSLPRNPKKRTVKHTQKVTKKAAPKRKGSKKR